MQKTIAFRRRQLLTQVKPGSRRSRLIQFAGFTGLAIYLGLTSGVLTADEGWFLQVSRRMLAGEILYRDIFFGATPLSVYLFNGLAMLFGVEAILMKMMQVLWVVSTLWISLRLARQLNLPRHTSPIVSLALLVYTPPGSTSQGGLYGPMAVFFMLLCFSAVLAWLQDGARSGGAAHLALAGVSAALCFASKQNVGLYLLGWLSVIVIIVALQRAGQKLSRLTPLLISWGVFLMVSVAILLPVWLSGGADKFLDYGFLNKTQYIRYGSIPYLQGLGYEFGRHILGNRQGFWGYVEFARGLSMYLLPFPAFSILLLPLFTAQIHRRTLWAAVVGFVAAALASVFPRMDFDHLAPLVAPLLIGMLFGAEQIRFASRDRWLLGARRIALAVLVLFLLQYVTKPMRAIVRGDYEISTLPHASGLLLEAGEQRALRENAERLRAAAAGRRVFLLFWEAGTYYLLTDSQNPTPFDYPLKPAFGLRGESDTIAAIQRGEIDTVCWRPERNSPMSPTLLEAFVPATLKRGVDLGVCALYQVAP